MDGMEQRQYTNMDIEELRDLLLSIQQDIDKGIRVLAGNFRKLTNLQNRRDQIEDRIAELGNRIGGTKGMAIFGEVEKEEEEEE